MGMGWRSPAGEPPSGLPAALRLRHGDVQDFGSQEDQQPTCKCDEKLVRDYSVAGVFSYHQFIKGI